MATIFLLHNLKEAVQVLCRVEGSLLFEGKDGTGIGGSDLAVGGVGVVDAELVEGFGFLAEVVLFGV
jgi:hypothetical protein